MTITINGTDFDFANESLVSISGYDLDITEPGFDKTTQVYKGGGASASMTLPAFIERRVTRCSGMSPCVKVYQDNQGKQHLTAYFD
jgi:hypothetical protein